MKKLTDDIAFNLPGGSTPERPLEPRSPAPPLSQRRRPGDPLRRLSRARVAHEAAGLHGEDPVRPRRGGSTDV